MFSNIICKPIKYKIKSKIDISKGGKKKLRINNIINHIKAKGHYK